MGGGKANKSACDESQIRLKFRCFVDGSRFSDQELTAWVPQSQRKHMTHAYLLLECPDFPVIPEFGRDPSSYPQLWTSQDDTVEAWTLIPKIA